MNPSNSKKALLVFPDEWIAFSPSVLNTITVLQENAFSVEVISFSLGYLKGNIELANHTNWAIPTNIYKVLSRLHWYKQFKYVLLLLTLFFKRKNQYDLVVGFDVLGFLAAKKYFNSVTFFSLEVVKDEWFTKSLQKRIEKIIIQSQERFDFLFADQQAKPQVYFVQNAPIINEISTFSRTSKNKNLLYLGNVENYYGIEECVNALLLLPPSYTLTLKGIKNEVYHKCLCEKYKELIQIKRLRFDYEYTPQDQLIQSIQNYYIGFVMYDFNKLKKDDFNFLSSPSGKLFNYYAAGIPAIGLDIIGLKSVKDLNTGLLLKDFTADKIALAITEIEQKYDFYAQSSLNAAKKYDFRTSFTQFLNAQNN